MATGYVVDGRGDLDALFAARSTAAISNTGFRSNGGVDLAQRFEARGGTTAIADTNFKAGGNDLAQLFKGLTAFSPDRFMTAGQFGGVTFGFDGGVMGGIAMGSMTNVVFGSYSVDRLYRDTGINACRLGFIKFGAIPPNDSTVWTNLQIQGVFVDSGGATVIRSVTRSGLGTGTAGPTGGNNYERWWVFSTALANFINGNVYGLRFT